jgi:heme A synthase
MTNVVSPPPASRRWLHRLAVLTVCCALPLLFLGAEVTTKKVGMVDQQGFRSPLHLASVLWEQIRQGETPQWGLVIEYAHRLAGFLVGICAVVLAAGLWWTEGRSGRRWLGLAALAGVSVQGLLGIFRVDLNALMGRDLALVHGCFAQLVFALLVSVALVTSAGWSSPADSSGNPREALRLARWGLATSILVYLQIVFGAVVRHRDVPFGARVHLLVAFGVVAAVVWLARMVFEGQPRPRRLTTPVVLLGSLLVLQLLLGVESWLSRFPSPESNQARPLPFHPELLRSLHFLVGALLFATTVVVALQAYRRTAPAPAAAPAPVGHLEGAV